MSVVIKKSTLATVSDVVDHYTVVLNRGEIDGVKVGDKYLIFGFGNEISDPETGESLGKLELVRGIGSVTHLQERICTVKSSKKRNPTPTIRTIKRERGPNYLGGLSALLNASEETVEERQGEPVPVEFEDVEIGDRARPI